VVATDVAYAGGGPAATAAVTAARLGVRAAFIGTVGDDQKGRTILAGLEAEGVDVSGVTVSTDSQSAASVIVVDRVHGSRAICNKPAPRLDISAGSPLIASAQFVHVDHVGWGPVAESALLSRHSFLSVDAGNPIPGFTPRGVSLYVPTVEALGQTYDPTLSISDLLALAIADGCDVVVATNGAGGSYALTATGRSAHAPAHRIDVVSTLGAGDVFHGALVAAAVRQLPLEEQLAFANVTAALSCRGLDGRSHIPDLAKVNELLPATAR
jgi:sugar/nucleoside kinase (ribokinase family)